MDKKKTNFKEAKQRLDWLRDMYSTHTDDELFLFEIKIVLQDDSNLLLPILRSDEIEIKEGYVDSLKIKFWAEGYPEKERIISYEIIMKVSKMMKETLDKLRDQTED